MCKTFAESILSDAISTPHPRPLCPMGRGEGKMRVYSLAPVGERVPEGRVRGRRLSFLAPSGFSLMEVLVGVMILGIVYATLFGLMSGSLKNVSRIEEREKM